MRKLYLGDVHLATQAQQILETMLGSCVVLCLRDPVRIIAGMCHYLLPETPDQRPASPKQLGRYGASALPNLLALMERAGAHSDALEAKIFGGAMLDKHFLPIGPENVTLATEFLKRHGIPILAQDVGGSWPRHVQFRVADGVVRVRKLKRTSDFAIAHAEQAIAHTLLSTHGKTVQP